MEATITFSVNGRPATLTTDPDRPLLEVLREDLGLTGTKCGCGEGRCGACTVLLAGKSTHACITPVGKVAGQEVLTIEGLASGGKLHPVQEAFLAEAAVQCGYCTPGMIMGLVGLLRQRPNPSDEEVLTAMEGHICRCCGYPKLLRAVRRAVRSQGVAP